MIPCRTPFCIFMDSVYWHSTRIAAFCPQYKLTIIQIFLSTTVFLKALTIFRDCSNQKSLQNPEIKSTHHNSWLHRWIRTWVVQRAPPVPRPPRYRNCVSLMFIVNVSYNFERMTLKAYCTTLYVFEKHCEDFNIPTIPDLLL